MTYSLPAAIAQPVNIGWRKYKIAGTRAPSNQSAAAIAAIVDKYEAMESHPLPRKVFDLAHDLADQLVKDGSGAAVLVFDKIFHDDDMAYFFSVIMISRGIIPLYPTRANDDDNAFDYQCDEDAYELFSIISEPISDIRAKLWRNWLERTQAYDQEILDDKMKAIENAKTQQERELAEDMQESSGLLEYIAEATTKDLEVLRYFLREDRAFYDELTSYSRNGPNIPSEWTMLIGKPKHPCLDHHTA